MRILPDQNAPRGLREHLPGHIVVLARQMGWEQVGNGVLIAAAEAAGFDVMITADQNIRYQQNLTGRRISLVVRDTNHWNVIRRGIARVREAVEKAEAGSYMALAFDRPPLVRTPWPAQAC